MRYIDINEVALPNGWDERAEEARAAVEGCDAADRPAEINGHAPVWRGLKTPLGDLSNQKCWYCETPRVRDDYAVDHYRPKSAKENDDHDGYWWLAFDHHNFRFSCKYCNEVRRDRETDQTGGKGSAFPLLEGGVRACAPEDTAGYDLVMEVGGVLRHIQLKASFNGSKVRQQTINAKLADKPSGCVVWIGFDKDTIELGPFYWFGGRPGDRNHTS